MQSLLLRLITGLVLCAWALALPARAEQAAHPARTAPQVMGWVESAVVYPGGLEFRAKLDSGARTSSIHTTQMRLFKRQGHSWVEFTIDNRRGGEVQLRMPVTRFVRIREHGGAHSRRPVVEMGICVGTVYRETEVNLIDRTGFLYPLLVGRTFLKNAVIIDPGTSNTRPPQCPVPARLPGE